MTINKELLKEVLATVKANTDHWDQTVWHCGSSHCFAGFTECIVSGYPLDLSSEEGNKLEENTDPDKVLKALERGGIKHDYTRNEIDRMLNKSYSPRVIAQIALGLCHADADSLFDTDNTLEDIEEYIDWLCEDDYDFNHEKRNRSMVNA